MPKSNGKDMEYYLSRQDPLTTTRVAQTKLSQQTGVIKEELITFK